MRRSTLKSTTSMMLSIAVATSPVAAQQTNVDPETLEICIGLGPAAGIVGGDPQLEPTFPCLDQNGDTVADQEALEVAIAAQVDDGPVEPAEIVEAPTDAIVEEPSNDDTAAAEEPAPEAAPDEIVAAEDAPVEEPVVAEQDAPEVEPVPEVSEQEETAPASEAEIATEADVATDLQADTNAEVATQSDAEADVAPEADATTEQAETTEQDALPDAEGLPQGNDDAAIADLPTTTDGTADEAEVVIETVEPDEPPAAAAASADTEDANAEVEVETLTDGDVRTSDQDFETAATGDAAAQVSDDGDGDSGLSSFEKALLLGLGAAVVGSVLNNGDEVVANSGDRVIVERNGELVVLKDDDVLLRQPGSEVQTRTFDDGSTRTSVTREDGTQIVTIRGNDGRVLRRARILEDGTQVLLFDDTQTAAPVVVTELPPQQENTVEMQVSRGDSNALRMALLANQNRQFDRSYSLRQIRTIREVRDLAPQVELDTVTFATGSAAIAPNQAEELTSLGVAIVDIIQQDPRQMFLIEGHTDAVGDAGYNLALSDRRAETVALALTEYFGVPPENLITQGYGESVLKVPTLLAERENRRAAVRNISSLLQ